MSNTHSSACCDHDHSHSESILGRELIPFGIAIVLFLIGLIFNQPLHNTPGSIAEYLVLIPAYLISGWTVLTSAGRNILRGKVFDENFLMTIATLGAVAIHELPEAVAVMLFFQIGELFQGAAVGRSRKSIKSLLEVRPNKANLIVPGEIVEVAPEQVKVGDIIAIKPGEKVPLDGEILAGSSQMDTSPLTGESVPRTVREGDTILAGAINQTGSLTVRVTKLFTDSSIAKILDLVEHASSKKAPTEKFITRFARYYTPIVVFLSLAVAIIPPLLIPGATSEQWVYRALVLLVISCPCGLVISIPLGYFGGVGGAAKRGILVKGATFLDALTDVKTVIFDKTGTLTEGVFEVSQICPYNAYGEQELLTLAAIAESQSNHPIARSIMAAYDGKIAESDVTDYQEIPGQGIRAKVKGIEVLAGCDHLLHENQIRHNTCNVEGTVVHIAADNKYAGYILISDKIKEDAAQGIKRLSKAGVTKTVMLTGDNRVVAQKVATQLGLDKYQAELLPEDKVAKIEYYLKNAEPKSKVAFVGDGINDSPVIARADVGIAMAAFGSDAAIEIADVVLMSDRVSQVAEAISVARRTHHIVWQNIIMAMAIKGLFILLGAIGIASLWSAVFADVGVALLAILNASRVL
ncbi:MAG: heavy metal translocating P-type ATPase [Xenococcaceae cyanobacterium MO_188.B19]|nr:heavy metal translocating P-type ATPase [Xenococcaceae cyanobacterium MO_188.B19]